MRAQDYIFADVSDIDISGEVLPQHDADGKWRVERAEDWAFLVEAWCERSMLEMKETMSWNMTPQQEEDAKALLKGNVYADKLKVPRWDGKLFGNLENMLKTGERQTVSGKWCGRMPTDKTWAASEYEWSDGKLWPEIFPKRSLKWEGGPLQPWSMVRRWEVENMRNAFADLKANEIMIGSEGVFGGGTKTRQVWNDGYEREFDRFNASYYWQGEDNWVVEIPKSVVFKMPQGRAQPKLGLLWHVTGRNSGVERYVLKTLEPSGVTVELLKGMAPEPQGGDDEVTVELDTVRVFWMPNLRTTLN